MRMQELLADFTDCHCHYYAM